MLQNLNDRLQNKPDSPNFKLKQNPIDSPSKPHNYMPSRYNVNERVPPITYSSKIVLSDLENKVECLDDFLVNADQFRYTKKMAESKTIVPLVNKIKVPNEFKKKPLRRHDNDLLLYKEIFVQPKEKILSELKEKEKNFESLFYDGAAKQYDKLLNIYDEEGDKQKDKFSKGKVRKPKEDNKLLLKAKNEYMGKDIVGNDEKNKSLLLKNDPSLVTGEIIIQNDKKAIERNFFDQQIQVSILYLMCLIYLFKIRSNLLKCPMQP